MSALGSYDVRRRAVRDLRHLLWFRAVTVRRRRAAVLGLTALGLVTVAAALLPAWVAGDAATSAPLLPGALTAVVLVSIANAVAGAGGREVLARDPASIHPISPVTDHLGALVLAPLNTGWIIQTWALLGLCAAVAGPDRLVAAQLLTLTWVVAATALGQAVAWAVEGVRRGPRGVALVRLLVGGLVAGLAAVGAVPDWRGLLVGGPARIVADTAVGGGPLAVAGLVLALLLATAVLVEAGGRLATRVARRMPRDEGRLETRTHAARPTPRGDLAMMRRIDRASIWRSVPLRRGTWLLALAPGLVALAGGLTWDVLVLMPGLVASGCVLLFGVNLWCLDGRGLLWRETLPVAPGTVLAARAWVLAELLVGAGATTLALGAVRAGAPTAAEAAGVVLALGVVVGQATSAGLRWSAAHPYAVDLRSARATPAPPLRMVGYSLRLSVATTVTGLLFAGLSAVGRIDLMLAIAAVSLLVSALRIARAARRWADPDRRARIVAAVAA